MLPYCKVFVHHFVSDDASTVLTINRKLSSSYPQPNSNTNLLPSSYTIFKNITNDNIHTPDDEGDLMDCDHQLLVIEDEGSTQHTALNINDSGHYSQHDKIVLSLI